MGRYVSGGGGSAGGASSVPAIVTTLTTAEAVQQGDFITLGADNLAYWAMDPANIAQGAATRPLFAAIAASGILASAANSTALATALQNTVAASAKSAVLSNGNIVHAWGCGSAPYNSVFMITDPSGAVVVPPTVGPANSSGGFVGLCSLTGGGFVLATTNQANAYNVYFTIYDNSGNVTTATTRFGASTATGSYDTMHLAGLSNGTFVMVADMSNAGNHVPYLGIYSAVGAVVLAPAALSAAGSGPASGTTNIVPLTGGNFGLAYSRGTGGGVAAEFRTYSPTGVQQGGTVAGRSGVSGLGFLRAIALNNGNWMAIEISNAAYIPYVYIFNAAGVQQGATITNLDTANAWALQLGKPILLSSGNVFLAYTGGNAQNGITGFVLSPAGAVLASAVGNLATGTNGQYPVAAPYGADKVVLHLGTGTTLKYFKYASGAIASDQSDTAITNGGSNGGVRLFPNVFSNAPANVATFGVVMFSGTTTYTESRVVYRQAQTPIGVAIASAVQGGSVPVQVTGNATLRLGVLQPINVDANSANPPGQRMTLVGNQVILSGIQATNNRRQIS